MVGAGGLEPPRTNVLRILSPVCLPISPPGLRGCEEPEIIYYRLIFFRILSRSIINIEGN